MGADINCNVGVTSKRFSDTLGPHGIDNRIIIGRELIYLYKNNNLKIISHMNCLMTKSQHTCWTILYAATSYSKVLVTTKLQK